MANKRNSHTKNSILESTKLWDIHSLSAFIAKRTKTTILRGIIYGKESTIPRHIFPLHKRQQNGLRWHRRPKARVQIPRRFRGQFRGHRLRRRVPNRETMTKAIYFRNENPNNDLCESEWYNLKFALLARCFVFFLFCFVFFVLCLFFQWISSVVNVSNFWMVCLCYFAWFVHIICNKLLILCNVTVFIAFIQLILIKNEFPCTYMSIYIAFNVVIKNSNKNKYFCGVSPQKSEILYFLCGFPTKLWNPILLCGFPTKVWNPILLWGFPTKVWDFKLLSNHLLLNYSTKD